jgi:flotillin
MWGLLIGVIAAVAVIALIIWMVARQYTKVGPNQVLVISGGRARTITMADGTMRKIGYRIAIGGGTLVKPLIEQAEILPLDILSSDFEISDVISINGINAVVRGTAQVKLDGSEPNVYLAAEQFLGKSSSEILDVSLKAVEGAVRTIIGTMKLEAINRSRKEFTAMVHTELEPVFGGMGLKLMSFNLKEIQDRQGYLEALGKPKVVEARRDAEVAEAEAARDALIKSAEAQKEGDVAKLQAETEVAEAAKSFEIKKSTFQAEINAIKAVADHSYELERHKQNQVVKDEEFKVRLLEKTKGIELQEKETLRRQKELDSTVKLAADAEEYRLTAEARGRAEAARLEGTAGAEVERLQGEAEAFAMQKKAESWSNYNQAAIAQMLIEKLPELARSISEPLSRVEKIIMVDGGSGASGASRITGQVASVMAQLPDVVEGLTGFDLKQLLGTLQKRKDDSGSEDGTN